MTTTELLTYLRDIGSLNSETSAGKDDDALLRLINAALYDELVPFVIANSADYFVREATVPLVAGQSDYRLPTRAVGNVLRDIHWTDGQDRQIILTQVTLSNVPDFLLSSPSAVPTQFAMIGNFVRPLPLNAASGSLVMSYFFRPGALVTSDNYRQVASVDSSTAITLTSAVPTGWSTANKFDAHSEESGAENRVWDQAASTVSGTGITFSSAIDGSVAGTRAIEVGDYVCLADKAAVPGLPVEAHSILAQAALCKVMESDGDVEALKSARQSLGRQLRLLGQTIAQRVQGKPQIVLNRNSFLRTQRRYKGF